MEKHEMMSLEDSGQLRDKIRFFEQELLKESSYRSKSVCRI